MKKKIAIIGSTGSIGKTLLTIVSEDIANFQVLLLVAHKNHQLLLNQAKKFKVKNLIITNINSFKILKEKTKKLNINVYNDYSCLKKIFPKKIDYIMSSITGLSGLEPTIKIIRFTKNIAIANKESIICAWNLIKKELLKNNTKFIPVDSEHFSTWFALKNIGIKKIEKIYLTASGGPFLNHPINKLEDVKISEALNHPNWKMGKKISIDSATMMNKVFEIIEAKNIFNLPYKKLEILIHPNSYVHSIIKLNNGLIKIILHDTNMKIPIFNTLYYNDPEKKIKSDKINLLKLNNLNLHHVNYKKFPMVKIINNLEEKISLFETVIVSANDQLVNLFLKNKISFIDIERLLTSFLKLKQFSKLKNVKPKNIKDILDLNKYVSLKINSLSV